MKTQGPKIILFDLETIPNLPEALKIWPSLSNYPGLTLKASISTVICFGWKVFEEDKKAQIKSAWNFLQWKTDVNDDSALCKFAYSILKDADAVVTQNGRSFDWKFLQTRLAYHNLPLLDKIPHVDTKVLAKGNLSLFSNSLKHMARFLTDDEKMENEGWELWVKVHGRHAPSMKIMEDYCKQDVEVLEKIFLRPRPFAKNIPNHNLFRRDALGTCPNCGSHDIVKNGFHYASGGVMQKLSCKECGTTSKVRLEKSERNSLKWKPKHL